MSQSVADLLFRRQAAQEGMQVVDIPVDTSNGPVLANVMMDGVATCILSQGNRVYQMQPQMANFSQHPSLRTQTEHRQISLPMIPGNYSTRQTVRSEFDDVDIRMVDADKRNQGMMSGYAGWIGDPTILPQAFYPCEQDSQHGVRIFTDSEIKFMEEPHTPTKFDADSLFHDSLFLAMQADILPKGASPIDDYLGRHADTRMRIYLNAVVDNQGCPCELHHCDLDQYLYRHKDVNSAIALRATLSDECRKIVQQPADQKSIKDQLHVIKANVEDWLRQLSEKIGQPLPAPSNPWSCYNESDDAGTIE